MADTWDEHPDRDLYNRDGLTPEEVRERLTYHHAPSQDGLRRHAILSDAAIQFMQVVDAICPTGRQKSLALTAIEEAKMRASAAVAQNAETC